MILAIDTHGKIGVGAGLRPAESLLHVGAHFARHPGISIYYILNCGYGCIIIGIGIDADQKFRRIDIDCLIPKYGPAYMGSDIAYAGNGSEFAAGAGHNAIHLRMRCARRGFKLDREIRFPECGKCSIAFQEGQGNEGSQYEHYNSDVGKPGTLECP